MSTSPPFDPLSLARPHLRDLVPYSSARDEFKGQAEIMLDANENNHGSPAGRGLHRYPDTVQHALKSLLAQRSGVGSLQIFLGHGSDEAIDLLVRCFCTPGEDHVITCPPTYGMYGVAASVADVGVIKVPLNASFQLDVEGIRTAAHERTKLLFLCSPNNPTGNLLQREDIMALLRSFPGIVVVDEAYVEYSVAQSLCPLVATQPNLVVLRTLSKAWGSAGLRLGMAIAHPSVINLLQRVKLPYNLGSLAQTLALQVLQNEEHLRTSLITNRSERERITTALSHLPSVQHVFPSQANFVLVRVHNATALHQHLAQQGIVVRDRSKELGCSNCLRITVGTPEENVRLLEAMATYPT
jgi:histidinol-phosphate aminotransferase